MSKVLVLWQDGGVLVEYIQNSTMNANLSLTKEEGKQQIKLNEKE